MDKTPFKWPTISNVCEKWDGACDKCGEEYPADTQILAAWSTTEFYISCKCNPKIAVLMETSNG